MSAQPYSFSPSLELLKEMRGLTAAEKLQRLEEANEFVAAFFTPQALGRWKRVPGGAVLSRQTTQKQAASAHCPEG